MNSYKTCVVVSKVSKRVFPYYIWILIIYCSFKKKGGQIEGVMVFNAIFNYISVISWLSCFIGGVY
jgi:hypothetical protein